MSETVTEASSEDKAQAFADAIIEGIAEDQVRAEVPALLTIAETIRELAPKSRSAFVTLRNRNREIAEQFVAARASIILPNGVPDWAGKSHVYKIVTEQSLTDGLGGDQYLTREERRKIQNSVSQFITRDLAKRDSVLAEGVYAYLRATDETLAAVEKNGEATDPAFAAAVRQQYALAGEGAENAPSPPAKFTPTVASTGTTGGPGSDAQPTGWSLIENHGKTMAGVTPRFRAASMLYEASSFFGTVDAGGEIPDRPQTQEYVNRARLVLVAALKRLDSKNLTENEVAAVAAAKWSDDDRKNLHK